MDILLLGCNGQVGSNLQNTLQLFGSITALDYPDIDFKKPEKILQIIINEKPWAIINSAAYTQVDKAESDQDTAFEVNAFTPGKIAAAAKQINAVFVHFSTDYVFDGTKGSAYIETDTPNPLGVYAQSKLKGDELIQQIDAAYFIFRTSWVYTINQESFVGKILNWSRKNETIKIVDDQIGSPTWAGTLAQLTSSILQKVKDYGPDWVSEKSGLYNAGGSGIATRKEWAEAVLKFDPNKDQQVVKEVLSAKTADFPTPTKRPLQTPLDCSKLETTFNIQLPDWKRALQLAFQQKNRSA